ncbi:MAG: SpoIIE family protein phosphatase [Candidatus Zixiibacteriota bacterium]|nr:MAG: SpoIIE family protein phosphatase [candidate division Zixibacteria bacterium]
MLKLVGTDGSRYYSWMLEPGRHTIGRAPTCSFPLSDRTVSKIHAEIEVDRVGHRCSITDMGSRNGTVVNGEAVKTKVDINEGDEIVLGQVAFKVALCTDTDPKVTRTRTTSRLAEVDPEKSVFLSINEALRPLPSKVTERPEVLPTLFEMAKIPVLPEPQEQMLQRALKLTAKAIPAERLAVLSASPGGHDIETMASLLPQEKDLGSFSLSRTVVDEILAEKTSILIDPQVDPRFAQQQSIIMSNIVSAMAVPLFDGGLVLGILYVDTTNPAHRYNDDYLRLLATFGNLIASRLLNYELIRERQEKQVLDAELRRASMIQRNLLTRQVPRLEGYSLHAYQEQCRLVGGDLYDLATLPDGRLAFVIADVSGKGMGGALLMSNILASFRILYGDPGFTLERVIRQVSKQLFRYSAPEDFATVFAGVLDAATHRLSFVNAGHNPALLVRRDGRVQCLEASGIMIGAFDAADWMEESVQMDPGDTLLVFTDGVVEADKDDCHYGDERLQKLVCENRCRSPEDLINCVIQDVVEFVDNSTTSDDITMLAIRRE